MDASVTLAATGTGTPVLARRQGDRTRRSDDLVDSRAMLGMVRFLMNRPTPDQIAEHIVLNLLTGAKARSAVLTQFGSDGSLHLIGSFGVSPSSLDRYRVTSMWDHTPLADAVRTGHPVVLTDPADVITEYPWSGDGGEAAEPVAVWPLVLPKERVGALLLTVGQGVDADSLRIDVGGLSAVLALYLSLMADTPPRVGVPVEPKVRADVDLSPAVQVPDRLSERQLEILVCIARGMTNPQISHRIGFSESTVRQESMAIYRFLGVGGRRDAVRVARQRGLLIGA